MSVQREIQGIQSDIDKIRSSANITDQRNAMSALLTEVRKFAAAVEEEKKLVDKISTLRKKVKAEPDNPEDKQDYEDTMELLKNAEELKSELSSKKSMLRRIKDEVDDLRSYLSKVIN